MIFSTKMSRYRDFNRYYYLFFHTVCKDNMKGYIEKRNLVLSISRDRDTRHSCVHLTHACTHNNATVHLLVGPLRNQLSPHSLEITVNASACQITVLAREFPKKRKSFWDRHRHKRLRSPCPRASWSNRSIENLSPRVSYT